MEQPAKDSVMKIGTLLGNETDTRLYDMLSHARFVIDADGHHNSYVHGIQYTPQFFESEMKEKTGTISVYYVKRQEGPYVLDYPTEKPGPREDLFDGYVIVDMDKFSNWQEKMAKRYPEKVLENGSLVRSDAEYNLHKDIQKVHDAIIKSMPENASHTELNTESEQRLLEKTGVKIAAYVEHENEHGEWVPEAIDRGSNPIGVMVRACYMIVDIDKLMMWRIMAL